MPLLRVPLAVHGLVVLARELLEEELIGAQLLRNFLHLFQGHRLLHLLMEEGSTSADWLREGRSRCRLAALAVRMVAT